MSDNTITVGGIRQILASELTGGMSVQAPDEIFYTVLEITTEEGSVRASIVHDGEIVSLEFQADQEITVSIPEPAADSNGQNGKPDLSQCEYVTEKGRRCKLAPGHEGVHRMVLRETVAQPKTLKELREGEETKSVFAEFTLTREDIPKGEDVSRQYSREIERDEDQKRADADAELTYKKWVKGGSKKGTFEELAPKFGSRYIVPPAAFDTVIAMLRKTTQSGAPTHGKKLAYRRGQHESGNTIINYVIVDADTITKGNSEGESGS